jgi:hypothetical protein
MQKCQKAAGTRATGCQGRVPEPNEGPRAVRRGKGMGQHQQFAPGMRLEIRDAEWRLTRLDHSSDGDPASPQEAQA